MPVNVVKTPKDERYWEEAKASAAKQGHEKDYAYIMGIFKRRKGMNKNSALMKFAAKYPSIGHDLRRKQGKFIARHNTRLKGLLGKDTAKKFIKLTNESAKRKVRDFYREQK